MCASFIFRTVNKTFTEVNLAPGIDLLFAVQEAKVHNVALLGLGRNNVQWVSLVSIICINVQDSISRFVKLGNSSVFVHR